MYDYKNAVLMLILLDTITQTFCQLVVGNSFFNMFADWMAADISQGTILLWP